MVNNVSSNSPALIQIDKDQELSIGLAKYNQPITIWIKANCKAEILLNDFLTTNNIDVVIEENANLKLKIITNDVEKTIVLHENLAKSSSFSCFIADFSNSNIKFENSGEINEGAELYFQVSSLAYDLNKKTYEISCNHVNPYTTSNIQFFGVSLKRGNIEMKGVSEIEKDCIKSSANQSAKIILFDKESKGNGSPILKIDCDDIKASHGCAIGSLNEDHIFYLKSRGLTTNEARKLITLGYLEPIKAHFNKEENETIDRAIKGGFNFD